MINYCGTCPHNGNVILTSYPPRIRCELTGKLHYTNDACDVDMVAVVRCKDCRNFSYWCEIHETRVDPESDYCSWGEKEEKAEPVRHGHWSLNPHNREWDVCSACGIGTKRREYGINPDGNEYVTEESYRYCPNCGAKMDGKESK